MLKAGELIDRYELVCPIGAGGMAAVWAARQRSPSGAFERLVALKIIHSRLAEDPAFRNMFRDEANIVAAIQHPNVAKVYDYVERSDLIYLVLEYIDGESLFALVSGFRIPPLAIALHVVAESCAGLHAAHSLVGPDGRKREVVHRDVSPQNILVGVSGRPRLIDFGIARARDRVGQATALGTIKGKIRYMAPEQARSEQIGPWTDVFAIGATLYRLIAGKPPYSGENDLATMQALLTNAPPLVPLPAGLPADVVAVVQQAVAPAIGDRFHSADGLRRAVLSILAELPERPDIPAWVNANMSEEARLRRMQLADDIVPESVARPLTRTAVMASPLASTPALPPPSAPGLKSTAVLPNRPLPPPGEPPRAPDSQRASVSARVPDLALPASPPASARSPAAVAPARAKPSLALSTDLQYAPRNRLEAAPAPAPASPNWSLRLTLLTVAAVVVVVGVGVAVHVLGK